MTKQEYEKILDALRDVKKYCRFPKCTDECLVYDTSACGTPPNEWILPKRKVEHENDN